MVLFEASSIRWVKFGVACSTKAKVEVKSNGSNVIP